MTRSRQIAAYVAENRTAVLAVTGAVLFLLLAFLAYRAISASRETRAADAYHAAQALMGDRKYADAAAAFREVAETYGGGTHGRLARLEQANALLLDRRPAEAALAYRQFLDAGPPADYLRQLALTRLAYASEERGDAAVAAATFAEAAADPGLFADDALLGQARVAEELGETEKARTLYAQFLKDYPSSDRRSLVTARLAALGGAPADADGEADAPS